METALQQLVATLGDAVRTDPVTCENYRFDWSRDPTAGVPMAVVRPLSAAEVQTAIRWAAQHRVAVVPRGAGSGLSGGSSAVAGGIVLSLERMRSTEIDTAARVAVVEPGAFNAEVKAAAAEHGLWYPPDPSSYEICSIGGNIATNAGGLCCVKYGVTTDYVLGLDVVLADGTLITLGGKRIKDVAGLSLLKLFVGSGGTLGIITRAILRLIPAQGLRSTLVAYFPNVQAAADTVVTIGRTLRASMMELMDQAAINAVEDWQDVQVQLRIGQVSFGWHGMRTGIVMRRRDRRRSKRSLARDRLSCSPPTAAGTQDDVKHIIEERPWAAEKFTGCPFVLLLGSRFSLLLRLRPLDTAGANPDEDAPEFVGIEPDAVLLAQVDDDAARARVVAAIHQFAAHGTGAIDTTAPARPSVQPNLSAIRTSPRPRAGSPTCRPAHAVRAAPVRAGGETTRARARSRRTCRIRGSRASPFRSGG